MRHRGQKGYTLLEVLMFIAVSSLLFVSTISAVNGRQRQVQLSQSTKEFDAKIRDIINDITTGYFPTNSTVSCEVSPLGEVQIQSSSNQNLGTNSACIYVGKAIQFKADGDPAKIRIYTLAGRRYSDNILTPVTSISEARPKAVSIPGSLTFKETSEDYALLYGLSVTKVIRPISDTVTTEYGSIGILNNFGGSEVSESQSVQIGGISGSTMSDTDDFALETINMLTDLASTGTRGLIEKNTDQGLVICLQTAEGKKSSISFGSRGSSTTTLQIDDYNRGCD